MIYWLVKTFADFLEAHGLGFLRVFTFVQFQAPVAVCMSFFICIFTGPRFIGWLRYQKIRDRPEFDQADVNKLMAGKKDTPTMGGLMIITAIAVTTLLLADVRYNFYVQMALVCLVWLGAVGATDDWLKLTAARRGGGRQGLTSIEKIAFQIGLGVILSYFTYHYGRQLEPNHTLYFPFLKDLQIPLGLAMFVLIGTTVITGTSNAVNLTDGLDGLAAGCMAIVSFTFLVLILIAGTVEVASYLYLPYIQASGQVAVLAGATLGACLGFLWFNCPPAKVFM